MLLKVLLLLLLPASLLAGAGSTGKCSGRGGGAAAAGGGAGEAEGDREELGLWRGAGCTRCPLIFQSPCMRSAQHL